MNILELKEKIKSELNYRSNTDDDKFTIPEVIDYDMYGLEQLVALDDSTDSVILDCGAHIGTMSVYAANLFESHKVISFEPNPDNFKLLSENTKNYKNVEIHNKAVGFKNDKLKLFLPKDKSKTGRFTLTPEDQASEEFVEVEVIDLIDFIKKLDKKIFILKLDLEGFEADIIEHFDQEVLSKIQFIFLEEHHNPINHKILTDNGFQVAFNPFNQDRHFVYVNKNSDLEFYRKLIDVINAVREKNYKRALDEVFADRNKHMFELEKAKKNPLKFLIKSILK